MMSNVIQNHLLTTVAIERMSRNISNLQNQTCKSQTKYIPYLGLNSSLKSSKLIELKVKECLITSLAYLKLFGKNV